MPCVASTLTRWHLIRTTLQCIYFVYSSLLRKCVAGPCNSTLFVKFRMWCHNILRREYAAESCLRTQAQHVCRSGHGVIHCGHTCARHRRRKKHVYTYIYIYIYIYMCAHKARLSSSLLGAARAVSIGRNWSAQVAPPLHSHCNAELGSHSLSAETCLNGLLYVHCIGAERVHSHQYPVTDLNLL